jgi:DNA-binding response OmpR family regulator
MNILVVEDDVANAELICKLLQKEKYSVEIAKNAKEAYEALDKSFYHLIILDWNLPDGSGIEILKETRDLLIESQVLMLSANSDIEYRVSALDAGADDYLCKPYAIVELLARVKSLLRRSATNKSSFVEMGDIRLDRQSREVSSGGNIVSFTSAEYDIFEAMLSNPNKTFTKFELLNLSNNDYASSVMSNIIEVHIKNIRKKLNNKEIIKTIRSVGYKINLSS